jgi:Flp pilus assembly protein TadG
VVPDQVQTHREGGAIAAEFALIVTILLIIVFGVINFGIIFSQQSTMNNAVREGARRAVVNDPYNGATASANPRTCDGIIASVKNQLSGLALDPAAVQIRVTQDGWTNANSCGGGFQSTSFGGNGARQPCIGSFDSGTNTARSIVVETKYVSDLALSVWPFPSSLTLTSKAVYRCEFSF